ncbi:hypothetical protein M2272_000891 [Mycobacterium frederiksbergense]|uniref:ChrB N-terminal domain-containing protein n=1 Tax=Mycolicibacterium frederiksbergense TaxID=117567 RepID=A0ABT6KWP1_9MYCO|nr:hypothetical protein [Mycolicibacterium frederiksbergense]
MQLVAVLSGAISGRMVDRGPFARHTIQFLDVLTLSGRRMNVTACGVTSVADQFVTNRCDAAVRRLVLAVRVPAEPSRHRIAVWWELRRGGALQIGQGMCVVPAIRAIQPTRWCGRSSPPQVFAVVDGFVEQLGDVVVMPAGISWRQNRCCWVRQDMNAPPSSSALTRCGHFTTRPSGPPAQKLSVSCESRPDGIAGRADPS